MSRSGLTPGVVAVEGSRGLYTDFGVWKTQGSWCWYEGYVVSSKAYSIQSCVANRGLVGWSVTVKMAKACCFLSACQTMLKLQAGTMLVDSLVSSPCVCR